MNATIFLSFIFSISHLGNASYYIFFITEHTVFTTNMLKGSAPNFTIIAVCRYKIKTRVTIIHEHVNPFLNNALKLITY
jgi:hypothetical protein